ncbi:MAG: CDP-2,3-bis-(O-geranylgeranyl)-sn-glycerol synthase [Candidatus Micrarchaeota archaeon]|nr:CDP-2,3-bis-(O-geranylgeranyl)-sn-glycerol synthase [Candidatus Micrarchaeota archaeon]
MFAASEIIRLVLFILPSYFANSTPVLLGGGKPLDFGRKWSDGNRIFGDGKTIRGFFAGALAGLLIGSLEALILPYTPYALYATTADYAIAGLLLGLGTMLGDLFGSFIKRRQGIARGKPSILTDQLMFLAVALVLVYPLAVPLLTLWAVIFLFVLTYFVHSGANVIANRLGLKKVPW